MTLHDGLLVVADGELYVLSALGGIYKIVPA